MNTSPLNWRSVLEASITPLYADFRLIVFKLLNNAFKQPLTCRNDLTFRTTWQYYATKSDWTCFLGRIWRHHQYYWLVFDYERAYAHMSSSNMNELKIGQKTRAQGVVFFVQVIILARECNLLQNSMQIHRKWWVFGKAETIHEWVFCLITWSDGKSEHERESADCVAKDSSYTFPSGCVYGLYEGTSFFFAFASHENWKRLCECADDIHAAVHDFGHCLPILLYLINFGAYPSSMYNLFGCFLPSFLCMFLIYLLFVFPRLPSRWMIETSSAFAGSFMHLLNSDKLSVAVELHLFALFPICWPVRVKQHLHFERYSFWFDFNLDDVFRDCWIWTAP